MATIKILSVKNGEVIQNIDNNIVKLTQNSVIQISANIDEVATITRQGNSAVIRLKNGESIIIENYFDYPVNANRIVFENEGKLYWAEFTDQNGEMLNTILYHPLTEGTVESANMAAGILPWLGGALAIGAIAAAAGSGGSSGGDSGSGSRDNTPPKLTDIIVNENGQLELSFNENINSSNPRPEDFNVIVDGEEIPVTNIIVEGDKIILVTEPEIRDGQEVIVDYQDSTPNNDQGIKDSEGNVLEDFDSAEVGGVKNPDTTAPLLIDAEVNENGNIELSFNEDVSGSNPLEADFTVTVDGTVVPVTDILINGSIITLITDPEISANQTVEVTYSDSTPGDAQGIQDSDGNVLQEFDAVDVGGVENNSEQQNPDVDAPVLIDAEVNENGNIELSFNEDVSGSNPLEADFTVTVDGTVVPVTDILINGSIITLITDPEISANQTVEVTYSDSTPGDAQGIQDSDGNVLQEFDAADLPNGVVNNPELSLSLANDAISALLVNKSIDIATPLATIDEQDLISVLPGDSRIAVMNFTIDSGTEDVVIAVQQDNLVDLAGAFTFVVRNTTTGEEFQVAAADTSQGGLVAGALELELLGGVADAQGLRLNISDLPAGNYEVSIYGDSSQLAEILTSIDLANLGDNTVNEVIADTILGLLETALTSPDADPRGLLEQLTLSQLLEVTTDIPALGTLTGAVNTILAPVLNNPLLGDLNNTSVGDIIAGNAGGALGFLLTTLGLGTVLNSLVNGILNGVDGAGQALFDNLVEPLVRDILLDTVLEGSGLETGLNSLLGSINTLLNNLGLGNVLPTVDGLLDIVAQEILSNPLTILGGTTAEVYVVNGETYRATGNIQETSEDGTQADNWGDGVLTAVNGLPITFNSTDADGKFTLIQGTYGVLKLYDDGNFIYDSNSLNGQGTPISEVFNYTVTRNAGQTNEETASADLTINIDTVNQIINYADDPTDNLLQGGAGNDTLTGGAGADTAIYYLLNNTDATGGNGTDIWTDFNAAEGDMIDVSALLSDQAVNASNLGNYITLEQRGDDTVVKIDRDGLVTDPSYAPTELIILQNTTSTSLVLDDLIKYNQI
ncbi:BapA prefix-like domain-containing protein [Acinetobacter sp. ANC 3781]|uniref:SwmB domain-containing protein n=1 Tax=Acinetobacter sp. ANC 3781 TaxID=2529835 RepID=UPI00103C956F|nr:SwmB domain-containing protein [Acinetobacter sp. ANC 3781]TCB75459.1 BapA prefix-like domain-containing protein [Acinetobacter sp. ANC 3781]